MSTIMTLIKRHAVLTYFILVFAISWGGILIAVGPAGFPAKENEIARLMLLAYLAMMAGPSVAGILLTGLIEGRSGLHEFAARLIKWRVGMRWYAVALLTPPLLTMAILLALSLVSPEFLPRIYTAEDKGFLLQFSIVSALMVGIFEELGWTGFAIPTLRRRYGVIATGLIVGLVLAAWDSLIVFWTIGDSTGGLPPALYLPAVLFTWLPAYRVLMVCVYERTESLLVAILMHTSLITFWTMTTPIALTGIPLVVYYLVFTAAVYAVVATLRGLLTLPRQRRANLPVQGWPRTRH